MAESIEDKTTRKMVEDRDLVLATKEKEIAGLNEQIASLSSELRNAWQHPLADDVKATKKILGDYGDTVELMVSREPERKPLSLPLYSAVRNVLDALDQACRDRDRYAAAYSIFAASWHSAQKEVEGKS